MEASLRGVRKAQIKLATYYLVRGAEDLARRVFEDMRQELPARLTSIREELARIESKDFWEIIDRGVTFDYLEPDRRATLEVFFGWFEGSRAAGSAATSVSCTSVSSTSRPARPVAGCSACPASSARWASPGAA